MKTKLKDGSWPSASLQQMGVICKERCEICIRALQENENPITNKQTNKQRNNTSLWKTLSKVLYCPFIPNAVHICVNSMMLLEFPNFLSASVVTLLWFPILKLSLCCLSTKSFLFFTSVNSFLFFFFSQFSYVWLTKIFYYIVARKKSGKLIWQNNITWQRRH